MRVYASGIALACGSVALICSLSANAQDQNSNASSFNQRYESAVAQAVQKCNELWSDHVFDPLRDKVQLKVGEKPSFKMLTSTERVSAKDKPVADLAIKTLEKCRQAWAPAYSMLPPQASAYIHGVEQEQDAVIAELYSGKITLGDYNVAFDRLAGKLAAVLSGIRISTDAGATEKTVQKPPSAEPRPIFHETRLALVIGNSNYANLPKPAFAPL